MMVIGQIKPVNGALCDRQQESRRRMVNAEMAGISASYNTHAQACTRIHVTGQSVEMECGLAPSLRPLIMHSVAASCDW